MRTHCLFPVLLTSLLILAGCAQNQSSESQTVVTEPGEPTLEILKRPNVLLIVADDLGYSDIGAFGGEIETPNLDELAEAGISFTNFHVTPACATTRASLMTGVDHHITGIGTLPGTSAPNQKDRPGYEGYLNDRVVTIAEALKANGYAAFMSGKWHLGTEPEAMPHRRGFDMAWDFTAGNADHFGLYARPLENGVTIKDLPEDFYSSNAITDKLLQYLQEERPADQPFFAYLAYTAPHFALQAPDEIIDKYAGDYDDGYESIRQQRLKHMIKAGLIPDGVVPARSAGKTTPWDNLTEEMQKFNARAMEIYAAMVDNMDQNIGRVFNHLKASGQYRDTFIIFMSDNGAATTGMESNIHQLGIRRLERELKQKVDNSLENMGRKGSWIAYGSGWGEVGSTPYRYFKHSTAEGGLRVTAIFGGGLIAGKRRISHVFSSGMDIMPTILEITDSTYPAQTPSGTPSPPLEGESMVRVIDNPDAQVHDNSYSMGFELAGDRAIYQDGWKMLSLLPPLGDNRWELYHLSKDPVERFNLADSEPEKLAAMQRLWQDYEKNHGVISPEGMNIIKLRIGTDPLPSPPTQSQE